jgi:ribosomal protein L32
VSKFGNRTASMPVGHCPTTGKAAFSDRAHAKTAARRYGTQNEVRPFRCGHCGYWHLGHHFGQDRQWHREIHGRD